jgi:hypothetical protein
MRLMVIILTSAFLLLVDQSKFRGYYTGQLVWALGYYTVKVVRTGQYAVHYVFRS